MSLSDFASKTLVELHQAACTPVLVIPSAVQFRPAFFVSIANELLNVSHVQSVRFDWLIEDDLLQPGAFSQWRFWRTRREVQRIHRSLQQATRSAASIELATVVSRVERDDHPQLQSVTVAISHQSKSPTKPDTASKRWPAWAQPIHAVFV